MDLCICRSMDETVLTERQGTAQRESERQTDRQRNNNKKQRERESTTVKLADDYGCQDTNTREFCWQITTVIPKATCGIGKRRQGRWRVCVCVGGGGGGGGQ